MTGGLDGINFLSSTEMMVKGDSSWSEVQNSLPAGMVYIASISINNDIITSGKLEKLEEIIEQNFIDVFILIMYFIFRRL